MGETFADFYPDVLLFLTATYALQRPCVYCSILLGVLVFSLFDFHADWFEPRFQGDTLSPSETASGYMSGNSTLSNALMETASMAMTAINGTGGSLASKAMEGVRRKVAGEAHGTGSGGAVGMEWVRGFLEKRQFRIPCVDVLVRL